MRQAKSRAAKRPRSAAWACYAYSLVQELSLGATIMEKIGVLVVGAVAALAVVCAAGPAFAQEQEYPMTFEALDTDGNGYISAKEAHARPDLPGKMQAGDQDGDGRLNSAEFSVLEGAGKYSPPEDSEIAEPGAAPY